ncbi:MAG: hypothetical protein IPM16_15820 [Chloroflexi bacterium]|nr:hypothetical protein [Chloroflexota bacterium]
MPKALFFNVPAHGHVNPSLPLVAELVKRGHDIAYFTSPSHKSRIEATGATVELYDERVPDDYFDRRGLNGSIPQQAARVMLTTAKDIIPDLLKRIEAYNPDYVLYDCMCQWGYYLGQITRLPSVVSYSLMPLTPRALLNVRNLRIILPMLVKGFRAGNEANKIARDIGAQYGVKPLGMMNTMSVPADLAISYSSLEFVPYSDSLPDYYRLVGWTMQDGAGEPFTHDSGRPLIYASLGTVINDNDSFYRACIAAFADSPYDVLISTGNRFSSEHFGALPPNVTVKTWVPQTQVLKQASLFITHGGLNSLHDGLFCGLPLLMVPQQTEQTFNTTRVVDLGAGLMLTVDQVNPHTLRTSADRLLTDASYRAAAERIRQSLVAAGGVSRAADEVEAFLKARGVAMG